MPKWARARVCVDVRACMHVCHRMRVYICVSTCACVYLRGCARGNVCSCVNICVCVCVQVYTRARVCASVRSKGEHTFSRVLFLRRLQINCLPISILPN